LELSVAARGAQALMGGPLAIAPLPGGEQRVGEVSGAAHARGVRAGMALGEALARCPDLVLVPADPLGVAQAWEAALQALESVGAAVEPVRSGLACFSSDALRAVHGGLPRVLGAASRALARPVCLGAGPTRFCALCAAVRADVRRPLVVGEDRARHWLGAQPTAMLRLWGEGDREIDALVAALGRLGLRTLGQLEALGRGAMADRFGRAGILAHRLACLEEDAPLHPRRVEERLEESVELGEASLGPALEQVLGVLVERLLARPERRGRTVRAATLSARLVEGGTWREPVAFRQALADARRMRLALSLRLSHLPAPVEALGLAAERLGPVGGEQGELLEQDRELRRARLAEALHQVRATAGREAALRVVCVDPHSRVPERRVALSPFPG